MIYFLTTLLIKEIQDLHSSFGFNIETQYQNNNNGALLKANFKFLIGFVDFLNDQYYNLTIFEASIQGL